MRKQDRSEKAKAAARKHQRLSGTDIKKLQVNYARKYGKEIHPSNIYVFFLRKE